MIEKYIEKDIIRHVKIVEYLYENKKVMIIDLSERIQASFHTIKRDLEKLSITLEKFILNLDITGSEVTIQFYPYVTTYDLVTELYRYSKFLQVCSRYLLGDSNYLSIVNNEFVSVSKAFSLKNQVEKYFLEAGILNKDIEWIDDELKLRLVMISIWLRVPDIYNENNKIFMDLSGIIINKVLEDLSNNYKLNGKEYYFLKLSICITIIRHKDYSIDESFFIPDEFIIKLKESLVFKSLKKNFLEEIDIDLSDKEILFLTAIYKNLDLNTNNYTIIEINYLYERNNVIDSNTYLKTLINKFEEEFDIHLLGKIVFERPLIIFIYSMWSGIQNYMVYRHHYLSSEQVKLKWKIKKILVQWKKDNWPNLPCSFNDLAIEHLVSQVSNTLTLKTKEKRTIFIVAENEASHILYREVLKRWINTKYIIIDNFLYYSLEDIPFYIKKTPYLIICERSILSTEEKDFNDIYPISRFSLKEDLAIILSELLNIS